MPNISSIIKNVRNIMRQDRGVSGDAQRLEQLGWMLFLKILDDQDQTNELIRDRFQSVIPEKFQWRNWATDPEGITGDELILFIDHPTDGLFASLRQLKAPHAPQRAMLVREVFDGSNNYMKSGYEMRKVINQLNGFDFNNSDDRHIFGTVYESILLELRDAGNKGEYYTPRAITQLMTQMTAPRLGERVLDPAAGTGGFLSAAIDYIRDAEVHFDEEAGNYGYAGYLMRLRFSGEVCSPFIVAVLASRTVREQIEVPLRTTVGINNVNSTEVSNLKIPLPPLAEQAAIVARVEALMEHCRALAAEIAHTRTHAAHLLQAVLKEAFAPATT